jgi:hypothetical protein
MTEIFANLNVTLVAILTPLYYALFELLKLAIKEWRDDDLAKRLSGILMIALGVVLGIAIGWMLDQSSPVAANALTGLAVGGFVSGVYSTLKASMAGSEPSKHDQEIMSTVVDLADKQKRLSDEMMGSIGKAQQMDVASSYLDEPIRVFQPLTALTQPIEDVAITMTKQEYNALVRAKYADRTDLDEPLDTLVG